MVALYFVIAIALPMALGAYVAVQGLSRSRRCPACADETLPLRSRLHRVLSRPFRRTELQLRWCTSCGWRGTARLQRRSTRAVRSAASPEAQPDQVDIRRLDIDGRQWKVMVQCWAEGGRWIGRLLFVGPDGQAHSEEASSLEGGSALEVLSTALSIPDRTLAGRIRRAIH